MKSIKRKSYSIDQNTDQRKKHCHEIVPENDNLSSYPNEEILSTSNNGNSYYSTKNQPNSYEKGYSVAHQETDNANNYEVEMERNQEMPSQFMNCDPTTSNQHFLMSYQSVESADLQSGNDINSIYNQSYTQHSNPPSPPPLSPLPLQFQEFPQNFNNCN